MNRRLIENYHSVVFAVSSMIFGLNLFFNPFSIRHSEEELHIIGLLLEHWFLALLLVIFGIVKLIGICTQNSYIRAVSLAVLTTLWSFIALGFFIRSVQGSSNYGTILTLIVIANSFGMAIRGRFK